MLNDHQFNPEDYSLWNLNAVSFSYNNNIESIANLITLWVFIIIQNTSNYLYIITSDQIQANIYITN